MRKAKAQKMKILAYHKMGSQVLVHKIHKSSCAETASKGESTREPAQSMYENVVITTSHKLEVLKFGNKVVSCQE